MAKLMEAVYGDALLEMGREQGILKKLLEEAELLLEILKENPEFSLFLNHPRIGMDEKMHTMETIFQEIEPGRKKKEILSREMLGFLKVVVEKRRQDVLEKILLYFINEAKEFFHIGVVYVTSPMEMTAKQKKAVENRILEITSYETLEIHYQIDSSLIGGLVIRIKDQVADSSVKNKLERMKQQLMSL